MKVHSSPALGADGTIYVGSSDKHLHAVSEANGTVKWKYAAGDNACGSGGPTRLRDLSRDPP